ncbi:MAG: hypothetical protein R3B90_10115 [Planctomycetaceae bacterium]
MIGWVPEAEIHLLVSIDWGGPRAPARLTLTLLVTLTLYMGGYRLYSSAFEPLTRRAPHRSPTASIDSSVRPPRPADFDVANTAARRPVDWTESAQFKIKHSNAYIYFNSYTSPGSRGRSRTVRAGGA